MPSFTKEQLSEAVAASKSIAETINNLKLAKASGTYRTIKKYLDTWGISTSHFDVSLLPKQSRFKLIPLEQILVVGSKFHTQHLKQRLYKAGLKQPVCELCGQTEIWQGKRMALILDHINGVRNDHRIQNLQIVCPNCNATLDTHCGKRKNAKCQAPGCVNQTPTQNSKYCSRRCFMNVLLQPGKPRPNHRKVERPTYEQLQRDIKTMPMVAVGKKYGVTDNAVRKWINTYEKHKDHHQNGEAVES